VIFLIKFRRAFENIYKLLRPNGKALLMFLGYHSGFEAYVRLKQHPRYKSYLKVIIIKMVVMYLTIMLKLNQILYIFASLRMRTVTYRIFNEKCAKMSERVCERCSRTLALIFCIAAYVKKVMTIANRV